MYPLYSALILLILQFSKEIKCIYPRPVKFPLNSVGTSTPAQKALRSSRVSPCRNIHGHINPRVRINFPWWSIVLTFYQREYVNNHDAR